MTPAASAIAYGTAPADRRCPVARRRHAPRSRQFGAARDADSPLVTRAARWRVAVCLSGLLVSGPVGGLCAQLTRRPPDNPAGNVNSQVPDARPTLRVRYVVPYASGGSALPDTSGVGVLVGTGECLDVPLTAHLIFLSRTAFELHDSTATFCGSGIGSHSVIRHDGSSRITGEFAITGREFSGWFPGDSAARGRITGWFAGDTLFIDQDCDAGGLPYVRQGQGPPRPPLQGIRRRPPCG